MRKEKRTSSNDSAGPPASSQPDTTMEAPFWMPDEPDPRQVAAWRAMSPARRLELAFQAYQFALDAVRLTERRRHSDLPPDELAWRVTRRMQGDPQLGK